MRRVLATLGVLAAIACTGEVSPQVTSAGRGISVGEGYGGAGGSNADAGDAGAQGGAGGAAAGGAGGSAGAGGAAGAAGGTGGGGAGSGGAGATAGQMVDAHNRARAGVNPVPATPLPPLQWSETLAKGAQEWADGCRFEHSGAPGLGENLYAMGGSGAKSAPDAVVDAWDSEKVNYDYATGRCAAGKVCGHYTQVVWRKSLELGCARAQCSANSPFGSGSWELWVCRYSPAGNYVGQKPY